MDSLAVVGDVESVVIVLVEGVFAYETVLESSTRSLRDCDRRCKVDFRQTRYSGSEWLNVFIRCILPVLQRKSLVVGV